MKAKYGVFLLVDTQHAVMGSVVLDTATNKAKDLAKKNSATYVVFDYDTNRVRAFANPRWSSWARPCSSCQWATGLFGCWECSGWGATKDDECFGI